MAIEKNSLVKMHYTGKLEDGVVFDSSKDREPLEFIFGMGMIVPGLEKGLIGLKKEDKKTVEVSYEEAYGPVMEEAIREVPKEHFPKDMELTQGLQLAAQGPAGMIPVTVKEILQDSVKVDFNHPLAGKNLIFEVEIVDEYMSSDEDKKRIFGNFGHDGSDDNGEEEGSCSCGSCDHHCH